MQIYFIIMSNNLSSNNLTSNNPKSINGLQCISKCYKKNYQFTHPLTLERIVNKYDNLCAVFPHKNENDEVISYDNCNYIDNENMDTNFEENLTMLNPIINFSPEIFLNVYYNIYQISEFYSWLENNINAPIFTQLRVITSFILNYNQNVDIFEEQLAINIQEIIKKFWIKLMYKKLCDNLTVINNKVVCVEKEKNKIGKSEFVDIRTKYIINEITTLENIFTIMNKYLDFIKKNNSYTPYYDYLISEFRKIILTKIK